MIKTNTLALWPCFHCDLHTNFWPAVSVFILSWPRRSTVAYSGLGLTGFEIFSSPSFPILKPCMSVINWGIFYKENKLLCIQWVLRNVCVIMVGLKIQISSCLFLVLCSTQFKNFTLTLGGHNLTTEFLPVQADWCCISLALSAWVSVP